MINVWLAVSPTLAAEFASVGTDSTLPESMQQQVMQQRGFDAAVASGLFNKVNGWTLYSLYLESLGDWPSTLATLFPNDHKILGAWNVDTGEQVIPKDANLVNWMPVELDPDGNALPPRLRDCVLLMGQASRNFDG